MSWAVGLLEGITEGALEAVSANEGGADGSWDVLLSDPPSGLDGALDNAA